MGEKNGDKNRKSRRVAVINFSGNVGKTTLAANLLAAHMPSAPFFSVESSNVDASADGVQVSRLRGKDFGNLLTSIFFESEAIIDVGASNIGDFLRFMQQYHASHEQFDYYIVPTVKERKQQADTINTIDALSSLGVGADKIRVVFNKVESDDSVEEVFAPMFGASLKKNFILRSDAVIYQNEAFERAKNSGKLITEILSDPTDYSQKARESTSDDERERFVSLALTRMLAVSAVKNLDSVFKTLFK